MTIPSVVREISSLLTQAGMEHHKYERDILKGIYDSDWAIWYADCVLSKGLNQLLNTSFSLERLTQILIQTNDRYEAETPEQDWSNYTAEKIWSLVAVDRTLSAK